MSTDPDSQPQAASPEQEGPPVEHDDGPRIVWPFDPWRPLLLALTVLATIFAVLAHLGIGLLSLFITPYEVLDEPVRALGVISEVDRRVMDLPSVGAVGDFLLFGSRDEAHRRTGRAWSSLIDELELYEPDGVATARLAQDVVLAGWGDEAAAARVGSGSLEELPPELYERAVAIAEPGHGRGEDVPADDRLSTASIALVLLLVAASLATGLGGIVIIIVWLVRGRPDVRLADTPSTGRFGLGLGYTVFIWCDVVFLIIGSGVLMLLPAGWLADVLWSIGTVLIGVPVVALVWALLLRPQKRRIADLFSLGPVRAVRIRLLLVVAAVLGIDWLFEIGARVAMQLGGWELPWHVALDESLLYGPASIAVLMAFDVVVAAPIVEEIMYRGVLYPALRTRLSCLPAALISGVIFGAGHGFDPFTLVVIGFSGVVYAIAYERTRSLVPCMIVHGLSNLGAVGGMLVYRFAL